MGVEKEEGNEKLMEEKLCLCFLYIYVCMYVCVSYTCMMVEINLFLFIILKYTRGIKNTCIGILNFKFSLKEFLIYL